MNDLLPCPFCASTFVFVKMANYRDRGTPGITAFVKCDNCGSSGPKRWFKRDTHTPQWMKQKASEAWNQRAESQRIKETD